MRTPLSGYYSPEVCCYYSTAVFINKAADGILFAVYCIRTGAKAGICVIMATNPGLLPEAFPFVRRVFSVSAGFILQLDWHNIDIFWRGGNTPAIHLHSLN